MRCTSSTVAVRARSRSTNISRQSPIAAHSLSCSATALRVVHRALEVGERRVARAIDFLLRERLVLDVVERREHRRARGVERLVLGHRRVEDHGARIPLLERVHADVGREALLDERLVQPARGLVVRARSTRAAAARSPDARRAGAWYATMTICTSPTRRTVTVALAVLHRLDGVACRQHARRASGSRRSPARSGERRSPRRTCRRRPAPRCRAGSTLGRTPAAARSARSRCRCARRSSTCRSCARGKPRLSTRSISTRVGLFSPVSNSLRTTVISLSRSFLRDARIHHAVGFEVERPVEVLVASRRTSRSSSCGRTTSSR